MRYSLQVIPTKFMRYYGNLLSNSVILIVPDGKVWEVELSKIDGTVCMTDGWTNFANYYSLEHGDLVVFSYKRNSSFDILIFDATATEIDYLLASGDGVPNLNRELNASADGSLQRKQEKLPMTCLRPHKKNIKEICEPASSAGNREAYDELRQRKQKGKSKILINEEYASKQPNWIPSYSEVHVSRKDTEESILEHPNFKVVIRNHTYKNGASAPKSFADKFKNSCTMTLKVADRTWPVNYIYYGGKCSNRICGGWPVFSRENDLKPGDVCVFQLVNADDMLLETTILRNKIDKVESGNVLRKRERSPVPCLRPCKKGMVKSCEPESPTRDTETSDELRERRPKGVSRKNKQIVTPNKFEAFGPVRQLSTGEKQSFLQRANALGSNATFVIAMQPTHVFTRYILHIPEKLYGRYFIKRRGNVVLQTSNRKTWVVEYCCCLHNNPLNPRLQSRGWKKFVQDNKLKPSDVCVFELMMGTAVTLKVSIFRVGESSNCPLSQDCTENFCGQIYEEVKGNDVEGCR